MTNNLTPEQQITLKFSTYREKWRNIALSTERINRALATEAVNNLYLYGTIGIQPPKIIWFDSPYAALSTIAFQDGFTNPLVKQLKKDFFNPLLQEVKSEVSSDYYQALISNLKNSLEQQLKSQFNALIQQGLKERFRTKITDKSQYQKILDAVASQCLPPELLAILGSVFDFARRELNCNLDEQKWLAFQSVVNTCGWIFPFGDTVVVCDRPTKILFNDKERLHAEGEPAISFVDNYSIYAYNGVILPAEYGKLLPSKWDSKWLLKNHSIELKKALIKGIGKTRIKQELTKEELKIVVEEQAEYIKEKKAKKKRRQQSIFATAFFENITPERESQIKKFDNKWYAIAFDNRKKLSKYQAEKAVKKAYAISKQNNLNPLIIFGENSVACLQTIINDESWKNIIEQLVSYLRNRDNSLLKEGAVNELNSTKLGMTVLDSATPALKNEVKNILNSMLDSIEVYSPLAELGEQLELKIGSQINLKWKEKFLDNLPLINRQLRINIRKNIYHPYVQKIKKILEADINRQIGEELEKRLGTQVKSLLLSQVINICEEQLEKKLYDKFADLGKYYQLGAWFDFCISVLGCECDAEMWSAFQELATNCPWIYARENVCVVAEVSLNYKVKGKGREANVSVEVSSPIDLSRKGSQTFALPFQNRPFWRGLISKLRKAIELLLLVLLMLPIRIGQIAGWLLINILRQFRDILKFVIRFLLFIGSRPFVFFIVAFSLALNNRRQGYASARTTDILPTTRTRFRRRAIQTQAQRDSGSEKSDILQVHSRTIPVHREVDAEGIPTVIFDDGVRLWNPRYWVHPRHQWQASWLLTEGDPDMFNVLIEEIGYARVCMELRTRTLDSWREYSLLEFPHLTDPNDFLRIVVLKMTCPSTGSVHAMRVPPDITTAREAIRWVNWGTDPEEFVVET